MRGLFSIGALATVCGLAQAAPAPAPAPAARAVSPRSVPNKSLLSKANPLEPDSSGHIYYIGPWWFAPSESIITSFDSIQVVPGQLPDNSGYAYVWPGLENIDTNFVLQNVLGNEQPAGQWSFATWYVGATESHEYGSFVVDRDDTINNNFVLQNAAEVEWISDWTRHSGGQTTNGGIEKCFANVGALNNALFSIELYSPAKWDFGPVTWSDIVIVANTTQTSWCTSPDIVGGFSYSMSIPQASVSGDSCTCRISSLVFNSP